MTDTQEAMRGECNHFAQQQGMTPDEAPEWMWEMWQEIAAKCAAQSAEKIARLEAVIRAMYECFKDVPAMESTGFDTPPEPASQWDYEAFLILAEAERILPPAVRRDMNMRMNCNLFRAIKMRYPKLSVEKNAVERSNVLREAIRKLELLKEKSEEYNRHRVPELRDDSIQGIDECIHELRSMETNNVRSY